MTEGLPLGEAMPGREYSKLHHDLGERVKELTILHAASQLLVDDARSVGEVLGDLVALMPPAWQYPEFAAARIAIGDTEVTTEGFEPGPWMQEAAFATSDAKRGVMQLVYLEERPAEAEGPFLVEERHLINSLATMVGASLDRRIAWNEVLLVNAELERRVAERTAALEAATRSLEAFTYSVAHDLKAPLRGIDGYSRLLLQDHAAQLNEEGRTFLYTIRAATERMNELIDDLLSYSRLDRRALVRERVALRELVDSLLEEQRAELGKDAPAVSVDLESESVETDGDALGQALRNYLDNAIKFTRGVHAPRIEIGSREVDGQCRVWVRDNGIGFDMKHHDRIFQIFERLHRAEDHPGTGIGLAIVRRAMERLGGRAWADSVPEHGATFYIEVPVTHGSAA